MKINALRKSQKVSAFRFRSLKDFGALEDFCGELVSQKNSEVRLYVSTEEMFINILPGDWVICSAYGEYSVVSPEIFAINYEVIGGVDV